MIMNNDKLFIICIYKYQILMKTEKHWLKIRNTSESYFYCKYDYSLIIMFIYTWTN